MNKWLVIHSLDDYIHYSSKVGNRLKTKKIGHLIPHEIKQPKSDTFGKIEKGDIVAYYDLVDHVLVGLFKVVSDVYFRKGEGYWKDNTMVYDIVPFKLPCDGKCYLDFKKLSEDPNTGFDKSLETSSLKHYSQETLCVQLSEKDFLKIEDALSNPAYFRLRQGNNKNVDFELLGALLNFHNSRATSFVSLFVASIFGIVTLSAIVRSFGNTPLLFVLSSVPYIAFVVAASYTLRRFFFYADIAENIARSGLQTPNRFELEKVRVWVRREDSFVEIGFPDFISQKSMWEKTLLNRFPPIVFEIFYVVVISFLTIIVYQTFIQDVIAYLGVCVLIGIIIILVALALVGIALYKNKKAV